MSEITKSEYEVRLEKVHKLKQMGVIPYAQCFDKKNSIQDIKNKESEAKPVENLMEKGAENIFQTAGRMMSFRTHGKLTFAKILDGTGSIQICFVKGKFKLNTGNNIVENLNDEGNEIDVYKFIDKFIDVGDFVGVKGDLFVTKHGELTIFVSEVQLLSKALRPLPEKFHGLQDQEEIYRKRYLDMTMNEESYKRFLFKSDFYKVLRDFYAKEGFTEIQTNILGNAASGAAAKPFLTHHNDYDLDVYLRIAFETALKKATVGRFEKVFEIGQDFRNEGSDPSHIQEFTQVEHYAVYRNYEDNIKFTEKMFDWIFEKMGIDKKLKIKDKNGVEKEVDFTTPRERIDYTKGINDASGIDITKYNMDDADKLRKDIKDKGIDFEGMDKMGTTTLIDYLYKKVLRPKIIGPAFIYNYPVIMQPLARTSDKDNQIVEQFQLLVNGRELCKAYSELVDPLIQKENFDKQSEAAMKGDQDATSGDDDFLTAMEYGMPPQSGFGMGLERVLAILTGQENIRDVVMFPLMKPIIEKELGTGN
ncbi:MAG: lysine--tRNA ligase [Candidatus Absconditabacterales bacterium]